VTREIAAEAALWVARLHGPDRDPAMEREFQSWQAQSPAHREAFGRCTDVWMEVPRVKVADAYGAVAAKRKEEERHVSRGSTWRWASAGVLAVLLTAGAMLFQHWKSQDSYITAIGEQRSVVLEDGTRMLLNTDTHVQVSMRPDNRTVDVEGGEALFEVAKDASRPFVVRVAGSEVVAVGTAFTVRYVASPMKTNELAVTLIEGKVTVQPAKERNDEGLAPSKLLTLQPGDRLQIDHRDSGSHGPGVSSIDRPNVEQVIAWKRSEVVFQDAPLAEAVSEMNRYSRTPVVLTGNLPTADLRVSGVFRTGDNSKFARAIAALHGFAVRENGGRLELENVR
jgi:transmembrane sensor